MFALIHNTQIEVGPRDWYMPMFRDYLNDNNLATEALSLPRAAPTTILLGTGWEILPSRIASDLVFNPTFEQQVGPVWSISATEVVGTYTIQDSPLPAVKNTLLALVKSNRYTAEHTSITLTVDDVTLLIPTDRETRSIFATSTPGTKWKFAQVTIAQNTQTVVIGDVWVTLTDTTIQLVKRAVQAYVQDCFDWEARIAAQINLSPTVAALRLLDTTVTLGNSNG